MAIEAGPPAAPRENGRQRRNRCGIFRRLRRTIAIAATIRTLEAPKHILVVDDDSDVRQVIADLLLNPGFRVSLAADGDAMRAFLKSPDSVDVIILDGLMPGGARRWRYTLRLAALD